MIPKPTPDPGAAASASSSASRDSASLEPYMRHARGFGRRPALTTTTPITNTTTTTTTTTRKSATLRKGRTNRILLYNGCFNPPHLGHLAHLRHAFRHGGADLDVVGAVVLVCGNGYLRGKLGRDGGAVVRLDERDRMALWEEGLREHKEEEVKGEVEEGIDWCWVFSEDDWMRVAEDLERRFEEDGFEVEFVRLAGGDKVSARAVQHGVWGCRMTITTDISRPVDFYANITCGTPNPPTNLRNHTPWELVPQRLEDEESPVQRMVEKEEKSLGPLYEPSSRAPIPVRPVYTCRSTTKPRHTLRFVSSVPAERLDPTLSSTNVRAIIDEVRTRARTHNNNTQTQVDELAGRLRGVALCPEMLAKCVVGEWGKEKREKKGNNTRSWKGIFGNPYP